MESTSIYEKVNAVQLFTFIINKMKCASSIVDADLPGVFYKEAFYVQYSSMHK